MLFCGFGCAPDWAVRSFVGASPVCLSARRSLRSTQSFIIPAETRTLPRAGPSMTSAALRSRSTQTRSPTRTASTSSADVSTGSGSRLRRCASRSPSTAPASRSVAPAKAIDSASARSRRSFFARSSLRCVSRTWSTSSCASLPRPFASRALRAAWRASSLLLSSLSLVRIS